MAEQRGCSTCLHENLPAECDPCDTCIASPDSSFPLWAPRAPAAPAPLLPPLPPAVAAAFSTLPTDAAKRKAIPIYSGFMKYFPDAIAAVAELSRIGNDQHNPGKPLHWDRAKSSDEMDALCRHMLDMASGTDTDTDGVLHATKQAWRAMAHLQKTIEAKRNAALTGERTEEK